MDLPSGRLRAGMTWQITGVVVGWRFQEKLVGTSGGQEVGMRGEKANDDEKILRVCMRTGEASDRLRDRCQMNVLPVVRVCMTKEIE
jgi:hypothetical protein